MHTEFYGCENYERTSFHCQKVIKAPLQTHKSHIQDEGYPNAQNY